MLHCRYRLLSILLTFLLLVPGLAAEAGWWTFFFPSEDAPQKGKEAAITSTPAARQLVETINALVVQMRCGQEKTAWELLQRAVWDSLPDYMGGCGEVPEGIGRFVQETLEINLDEVVIERYLNPGDVSEGITGDPIFFVRRRGGGLVAVVKSFMVTPQNLGEFSLELNALCLLKSLDLRESETVSVLALGRLCCQERNYALLAMSAAPGISVTRHFKGVGVAEPGRARGDQMALLRKAVAALARASAELHVVHGIGAGEIAPVFWNTDDLWFGRFLDEVERNPELMEFSPETLREFYSELQGGVRQHRHSAGFVHSDANTGNYLYDVESDTLTIIDTGRLCRSVGTASEPKGPPAHDYVWILAFMRGIGDYYGLTAGEISDIQRLFETTYQRFPGVELVCSRCLEYHRFVFWATTVALYRRPSVNYTPQMRKQLETFIDISLREIRAQVQSWLNHGEQAA